MQVLALILSVVVIAEAEPPATQTSHGRPLRIIFVGDASAAETYAGLAQELDRALNVLMPTQSFNVIVTCDGKVTAAFERLVVASPKNRRRAQEFVHLVKAGGDADVKTALQKAMADDVQVIHFGAVSAMDDAAVGEVLAKRKGDVVINVAWLTDKEEESRGLRRLAEATGGKYRVVRPGDLAGPTTRP